MSFKALALTASLGLCVASCGSDGSSEGCNDTEVQVSYLGTSNDREECKAIPSQCGGTASCQDTTCLSAMYDLCAAPAFGVACSDTSPPTIISCNE